MTQHDAISHWRKGSLDALQWAEKMARDGASALALFHCHLAVEKALKALHMESKKEPAPHTHSLTHLASLLDIEWSEEELSKLQELTPFASQARYDDIGWVESNASPEFVEKCMKNAEYFLSKLNCADNS